MAAMLDAFSLSLIFRVVQSVETSFCVGLPPMACAFVRILSVPAGKKFTIIVNQKTKSKAHVAVQRQPERHQILSSRQVPMRQRAWPRFHACLVFIAGSRLQRQIDRKPKPKLAPAYGLGTSNKFCCVQNSILIYFVSKCHDCENRKAVTL